MNKKKIFLLIIPTSLIAFATVAPSFLFRQTRISYEINRRVDFSIQLDISSKGVRIVDFYGRWFSMYAKLELPAEEYDKVKQIFLLNAGTTANKDFAREIIGEQSKYQYDNERFLSDLSNIQRAKHRKGLQSMNLDDYKEIFIAEAMYGVWFSTGGTSYVLVKENNENCFLYIYSRL